jgi:hypothetical protein
MYPQGNWRSDLSFQSVLFCLLPDRSIIILKCDIKKHLKTPCCGPGFFT